MVCFWAFLYGITYTAASHLSGLYEVENWILPICMVLYVCAFILWIIRHGELQLSGLCFVRAVSARSYAGLPLLFLLPLVNVLTVSASIPNVCYILTMLCVSLTEEIFFRGYLLNSLKLSNTVLRILFTSAVFALMHSVNFLQGGNPAYVFLQILCAFFVSICYCSSVIQFRSILPCAAAHFFTNITGNGAVNNQTSLFCYSICIIIYAIGSGFLCRNIALAQKER